MPKPGCSGVAPHVVTARRLTGPQPPPPLSHRHTHPCPTSSRRACPSAGDAQAGPDGATEPLKSLAPQYDAAGLEEVQYEATSADGTKVPYFVIRRKGLPADGGCPTLMFGYGGFEVSLTPGYIAVPGAGWLERGGCFVQPNIRGGGEFGPSWHQVRPLPSPMRRGRVAQPSCRVVGANPGGRCVGYTSIGRGVLDRGQARVPCTCSFFLGGGGVFA